MTERLLNAFNNSSLRQQSNPELNTLLLEGGAALTELLNTQLAHTQVETPMDSIPKCPQEGLASLWFWRYSPLPLTKKLPVPFAFALCICTLLSQETAKKYKKFLFFPFVYSTASCFDLTLHRYFTRFFRLRSPITITKKMREKKCSVLRG